ncbi:hypothetical protein OsJ_28573 [Oryza sativa Japonica Group]|uniref:Uncharacterized protein n=1 Tax=Oryza sativa subsp. japonica TaxID=39947 RepID=B9G2E9_ORYSJ|nr:hypothetical protein OsJ_28573 [Oryza sativa Japonica Group]
MGGANQCVPGRNNPWEGYEHEERQENVDRQGRWRGQDDDGGGGGGIEGDGDLSDSGLPRQRRALTRSLAAACANTDSSSVARILCLFGSRGPAGQDGAHQESAWEGCVQLLSCVPKLTVTLLWLRRTVLVQSDGGEWAEREGYHHARGPEPLDAQATAIGSRTSL